MPNRRAKSLTFTLPNAVVPTCGGALSERYRQARFVITLTGGVPRRAGLAAAVTVMLFPLELSEFYSGRKF